MPVVPSNATGAGAPVPPAPVAPVPVPDPLAVLRQAARVRRLARERHRAAGGLLAVSAALQILAPAVSLFALKAVADAGHMTPMPWPEFLGAINASGHGWLVGGTVAAHVVLAVINAAIARALWSGWPFASPYVLPSAILTIVLSFFVLGGPIGILAGVLAFIAVILAVPSRQEFLERFAARATRMPPPFTLPPPLPGPRHGGPSTSEPTPPEAIACAPKDRLP